MPGPLELRQRVERIVGRRHLHARRLELAGENLEIERDIIDQQRPNILEPRLQAAGFAFAPGDGLERHLEPEGRARPRPALDADLAVHECDELTADRQTQSGAAKAPGDRAVGLRELLEQPRAHLFRHADPGILHFEAHAPWPTGAAGLARHGRLHRDAALFRELDGVADEIDQDLPQARRVAAEMAARRAIDEGAEVEALLARLGREQGHRGLDRVDEIEVDDLDLDLAGLELRDIENVIDDGEQRIAGFAHDLRVVALLLIELRPEQQVGHAENRVHRRADLVTHIGKELGLAPARRLRLLLGDAQRLLELALPSGNLMRNGDVAESADAADGPAVLVADHVRVRAAPRSPSLPARGCAGRANAWPCPLFRRAWPLRIEGGHPDRNRRGGPARIWVASAGRSRRCARSPPTIAPRPTANPARGCRCA